MSLSLSSHPAKCTFFHVGIYMFSKNAISIPCKSVLNRKMLWNSWQKCNTTIVCPILILCVELSPPGETLCNFSAVVSY